MGDPQPAFSAQTDPWESLYRPELAELHRAAQRERGAFCPPFLPDPVKRKQAIRDTLRYMAENWLSMVMFRPIGASFWQPYLKNFADNWQQDDWNAPNVWLEK